MPSATPSPVKVRPASDADGEALGRMGGALCRQHHDWDPPRFMLPKNVEKGYRDWLVREAENPRAVVLVAEVDATVVGYAYGTVEGRDWNLLLDRYGGFHDLWVDETARRMGAGEKLVEAMVAALASRGAPRVVLMTAAKNETAQRFFARVGFRPTMVEMTRELPEERGAD